MEMLEILKVNSCDTKGMHLFQKMLMQFHLKSLDKLGTIDNSKLVTGSNTGYEIDMDTGLDDVTN